jgi:phosphonatase-like hydrolase
MKIELIVFDMAGTTVQDEHEVEACFAQAAHETGLNVTADRILELQGYSKIEVIKMLWAEANPLAESESLTEKVNYTYQKFCEILENHYLTHGAKPTEGCLEIFQFLKANNIKIALTTGFYRKVTNIILQKLGWLHGLDSNYMGNNESIIDISIASDEVSLGRPKPDMILRALELLKIEDKSKVIVIGDTPSDIMAGDAANVGYVVAITIGTHTAAQLSPYFPQIMVHSLADFETYIKRIISQNH